MIQERWRALLRKAALIAFWVCAVSALLWIYTMADFFVVRPRVFQTELFGHPIAGLSSLQSAKDDCCAGLGDGRMSFTYRIDTETARKLTADCRRDADRYATVNYFRASGECVVRNAPFEHAYDGGYTATVNGNVLGIEAVWM
jgi:hypothetical protein